jgi:hypothetical protein
MKNRNVFKEELFSEITQVHVASVLVSLIRYNSGPQPLTNAVTRSGAIQGHWPGLSPPIGFMCSIYAQRSIVPNPIKTVKRH